MFYMYMYMYMCMCGIYQALSSNDDEQLRFNITILLFHVLHSKLSPSNGRSARHTGLVQRAPLMCDI